MGGGVMPKLIQINETVTACRNCVYRFTRIGQIQHSVCNLEIRDIPDPRTIPSWCPLPDAPAPVGRRCGTCRWWKLRDYTVGGCRVGVCQVPLAEWIELSDDCGNGMEESEGTDCPAWAAKESNG